MSPLPIDPALVSTTGEIPGYRIVRSLGVSEGISVTQWTGIFSGGQKAVLRETMSDAFLDMVTQAASHGAQGVVGLHFITPQSENERIVIAYGTAVTLEKIR